jgi:RNA 3'-terminal phosphate cyclase-like protein
LTINGITNDNIDISVDLIRTSLLRQLPRFGIEGNIELKIIKRGARPNGGGKVILNLPIVKTLKPFNFTQGGFILFIIGRVKRIRGIAYCTRISPLIANRMQESARSLLTKYIPDVYIYTDVFKGTESGLSPGYALSLVAETDTDALISTECTYQRPDDSKSTEHSTVKEVMDNLSVNYEFKTPEELAIRTTKQLLTEIKKGGTVDSQSQWLTLLYMTLTPTDISKVVFGKLTKFRYLFVNCSVVFLRDIEVFFGVRFKVKDVGDGLVEVCGVGVGFVNVNRAVT